MTLDGQVGPTIYHMFPLVASKIWQEGGKKSPALRKVSPSTKLTCPSWLTPVPSWHSSSCPSSSSSSICPRPCALHWFPIQIGGWCPLIYLAYWGCCFPPGPPSLVSPPSGDDYRSAHRCPIRHVNLQDVICSFGLAVAPTPGYVG